MYPVSKPWFVLYHVSDCVTVASTSLKYGWYTELIVDSLILLDLKSCIAYLMDVCVIGVFVDSFLNLAKLIRYLKQSCT